MDHAAVSEAPPDCEIIEVVPGQLKPCLGRLNSFVERYAHRFPRASHCFHAKTYLEGRLSDLPRKTIEPIAVEHDEHRKPLQHFVGAGPWEDEDLLWELHDHVREELGDPQGTLIFDGSAMPKKGTESVGVQRQWCGRLGKVDNCQIGVFAAYSGRGSATLVDRRLYLPKTWVKDPDRRKKARVPPEIEYRTSVELALDLYVKLAPRLPFAWLVADDEFGRAAWFRRELAERGARYILDVPSNTRIRDLDARPPRRRSRRGGRRMTPFVQARRWARRRAASGWTRVLVRNGEKGPLELEARRVRVTTREGGRVGCDETLLVMRTLGAKPQYRYALTNADPSTPLEEMVRACRERHRVEECFEHAKGEAGLAQYEVRSWIGWHHHMTLSLLAAWFVTLEQRRLEKKYPGSDGPGGRDGVSRAIA